MLNVVTHSGKFHADDVLAWSLLCQFHPKSSDLNLTRTRDATIVEQADIVFDVGGIFNPTDCRFDHHQNEYQGPLSSAGMVLKWLLDMEHIDQTLFTALNETIVSYVDDVDNGRIEEDKYVPWFSVSSICIMQLPTLSKSLIVILFGSSHEQTNYSRDSSTYTSRTAKS